MAEATHRGHAELAGAQHGATLTLGPGSVTLEVASIRDAPSLPEQPELIRFTSNTGYFTLVRCLRRNHSMRLGVAGLSTYVAGLALENAHFRSRDEMRSRTWSMHVEGIARILHVNGVIQQLILPDEGGVILNYTVSSPAPVPLHCPSAGITVSLGQHIRQEGNAIDGPALSLSYPADIAFPEAVDIDAALRSMNRIQQLLSLVMGRALPIASASMKLPQESGVHEVAIHGLLATERADKPTDPIVTVDTAAMLAPVLDRWLARYDELEDAIRLHMSGLEQRRLPTELRFQIFVQSLEALHRRTVPAAAAAIHAAPILDSLRGHGIGSDVVDRVAGVLAHAHEPGLRQRLRHYWDRFEPEIAALRPGLTRKAFIARVAATRNHYAHRTDRDDQVLDGLDLWDATETIKALSHMALLQEVGVNITGIGMSMLERRFAEYAVRG